MSEIRFRVDLHHHHHAGDDESATSSKLDHILALLQKGHHEMTKLQDFAAQISAKVGALGDEVREQTTIEASIATLLNGMTAQVADLKAQIAVLVEQGDTAAVEALQPVLDALTAQEAALRDSNERLKADVLANTNAGSGNAGDTVDIAGGGVTPTA